MSRHSRPSWCSLHLFAPLFAPPSHLPFDAWGDRLAVGGLGAVADDALRTGLADRFFFIRYGELGPHLRFRLRSPDADSSELRTLLAERFLLSEQPEEDEHGVFYPSRLPEVEHARFLPYEPETARYGGPDGVAAAEAFFHASSRAAINLLARGMEDEEGKARPGEGDGIAPGRRAAFAVLALTATLHGLAPVPDRAAALAELYSRGWIAFLDRDTDDPDAHRDKWEQAFEANWERQEASLGTAVADLWQALDSGAEAVPAPYSDLAAAARALRAELHRLAGAGHLSAGPGPALELHLDRALDRLVPSYLHMTSNRLGITTFHEAFLGYLGKRAIASSVAQPRNPL